MEITDYKSTCGEDMVLVVYTDQDRTESMFKWQWEERLARQAEHFTPSLPE